MNRSLLPTSPLGWVCDSTLLVPWEGVCREREETRTADTTASMVRVSVRGAEGHPLLPLPEVTAVPHNPLRIDSYCRCRGKERAVAAIVGCRNPEGNCSANVWACPLCGRTSRYESWIQQHLDTVHRDDKVCGQGGLI